MNAFLFFSALVAMCAAAPAPQFLAAPWAHHGLVAHAPLVKLADDGQYRTGLYDSAIDLRGQYAPDSEGAYIPDDEGAYRADDEGSYKPDSEGAYDAVSAHAKEALSEDGSYKGEPVALAYAAAPAFAHTAYAAAPAAHWNPLWNAGAYWNGAHLAYSGYPAVIKA